MSHEAAAKAKISRTSVAPARVPKRSYSANARVRTAMTAARDNSRVAGMITSSDLP
jgi:hypothetical protein